ncbi:MAG: hypothetical protein Q9213_006255 [Squamulea squamosa]
MLATLCSARPAIQQVAQSLNPTDDRSGGLPHKFVSIELSRQNASSSDTVSLRRPLDPPKAYDLERRVMVMPGILPSRGVELVAPLAYRIYRDWRDTANRRIFGRVVDRGPPPFTDVEFVTQPKFQPGAVLTPAETGTVRIAMMIRILHTDPWPGVIRVGILEDVPSLVTPLIIGTLSMTNSPLRDEKASQPSTSVGLPNHLERRWLGCWTGFFLWCLKFSSTGYLTREMPPGDTVRIYHIKCGINQHSDDLLEFALYPISAIRAPTWDFFALSMQEWLKEVARNDFLWERLFSFRDFGGFEIATVSIRLDAVRKDPSEDGTATA